MGWLSAKSRATFRTLECRPEARAKLEVCAWLPHAVPTSYSYAGKCVPRVSAANGIRSSPSAKATEVIATGVPSDPKCRTPAPTRKVIPAPPNRANEVEKAKALARHSVGYCSGSQRVYTAKLAPPNPRKKRQTKNHGSAVAPR